MTYTGGGFAARGFRGDVALAVLRFFVGEPPKSSSLPSSGVKSDSSPDISPVLTRTSGSASATSLALRLRGARLGLESGATGSTSTGAAVVASATLAFFFLPRLATPFEPGSEDSTGGGGDSFVAATMLLLPDFFEPRLLEVAAVFVSIKARRELRCLEQVEWVRNATTWMLKGLDMCLKKRARGRGDANATLLCRLESVNVQDDRELVSG